MTPFTLTIFYVESYFVSCIHIIVSNKISDLSITRQGLDYWERMCVDLGERHINIIITVRKAYKDHHYYTMFSVHSFSFFMPLHVFQLCYCRLETPLKRRCQNMGSILFTLPVFPQIRTHSHLYRAFKWVTVMRLHNAVANCCISSYLHRSQVEGSYF